MSLFTLFSTRKAKNLNQTGGVSFNEAAIIIGIGLIFVFIVIWDDFQLRPNISLKTCMTNMSKIHEATKLAIMENPEITNITVEKLVEMKLLEQPLRCPNIPKGHPEDGHYRISADFGQAVDVYCHNNRLKEREHGSFLRLKAKYLDETNK
jgi:hypothetical protein